MFIHDGFFGNATNSYLADATLSSYTPRNCFYRNLNRAACSPPRPRTSSAPGWTAGPAASLGPGDVALADQMICNTGFEPCPLPPSEARYPRQTRTVMIPLPRLASTPGPCAGVPKNAFCS